MSQPKWTDFKNKLIKLKINILAKRITYHTGKEMEHWTVLFVANIVVEINKN